MMLESSRLLSAWRVVQVQPARTESRAATNKSIGMDSRIDSEHRGRSWDDHDACFLPPIHDASRTRADCRTGGGMFGWLAAIARSGQRGRFDGNPRGG